MKPRAIDLGLAVALLSIVTERHPLILLLSALQGVTWLSAGAAFGVAVYCAFEALEDRR